MGWWESFGHTETLWPTNLHVCTGRYLGVNVCIKGFYLWITARVREKKQGNMNATVEAFAFFLGFLGWLMVGVTLPNRYWRVSTVDGNVITTSTIYENLWMSCATDATGVHNCRDFPSLLALNGMWPTEMFY